MPSSRFIRLSDGSTRPLDDTMNDAAITKLYHDEENKLLTQYTNQAKQQRSPVETGSTIYSQTRAYPNNWQGKVAAHMDHLLYPGAGDDLGSAERIGTMAGAYAPPWGEFTAPYDLGATGVNALKHGLSGYAPSLNQYPDVPTVLGAAQTALQVPPPNPDASSARQVAEVVAGTLLGHPQALASGTAGDIAKNVIGNTVRATGATLGGEGGKAVAEQVFGPQWGSAGQLAGSFLGQPQVLGQASGIPRVFAKSNASDIADAAGNIGVEPSTATLANVPGQRVMKILGGLPIVGLPTQRATESMNDQLIAARDKAAEQVAGGPLPQGGADDNYIGEQLIKGSQQAVTGIRQSLANEQENIAQQMKGVDVDVRPIANQMMQGLQGNVTTPQNTNLIRGRVQDLLSMAPGGANYDASRGGNVGAGMVPWSALKDWRTSLTYELEHPQPGQSRVPENFLNTLKKVTTDTMQQSADLASPGLGQQFRDASTRYAQMQPVLDQLDPIAGAGIRTDNGTVWQGGYDPGQAAGILKSKKNQQGSDLIENIFANSNLFPSQNWGNAAGGLISQLGRADQGTFRPEWAARDWSAISDPVKDALTQGPSGGPLAARSNLDDLATVGKSAVVPVSRHGLTEAAGTGAMVAGTTEAVQQALEHLGLPAALAAGSVPLASSYIAESAPFQRAMTQPYGQGLTDQIYQGIPTSMSSIIGTQGGEPWTMSNLNQPTQPVAQGSQ